MSVNHLAERIHELHGDCQSLEWWIENLRAKGEEPSGDVFAELREVSEALVEKNAPKASTSI